jgi:VanZ family protein
VKHTFLASPRVWGLLSLAIFFGILFCTLWPFKLSPGNNARWHESGGIDFGPGSIAFTTAPLTFGPAQPEGNCTLEVLARPVNVYSEGTILGVYSRQNPKQFVVRQWHDGLLVTHDLAAQGLKRQKLDVNHAFQAGKPTLVTITSGANGTVIFLNGKEARKFSRFFMTRQELSGQLVFGNSATDYAPWGGELRGVAVYSRELTPAEVLEHYEGWMGANSQGDLREAVVRYDFARATGSQFPNEAGGGPVVQIPKIFTIPGKVMLKSPRQEYKDDGQFANDFLVNVIGFIPLGFLLCGYWTLTKSPRFAFMCAALSCGTFSFLIEVTQTFIPKRGSGWTDVISNSLGGILGAILAQAWFKWSGLRQNQWPASSPHVD